jgi:hypothetical protein
MTTQNNDLQERMIPNKQKNDEDKNKNQCQKQWAWFKKDPMNRWPFIIFFLLFPLAAFYAVWSLMDEKDANYAAFGSAIAVSLFGFWHFRILMKLKEQVDRLHLLNAKFRKENTMMKQEVSRLTSASDELTDTRHRLHDCNERNRVNIQKFQALSKNLKTMGGANAQSMHKINEISNKMNKKWNESLLKHHRQTLSHIFEKMEFKDDQENLGKSEFEHFLQLLPKDYQQAFHKMGKTFEQLSGDDGQIDIREFTMILDEWVDKHMSKLKLPGLDDDNDSSLNDEQKIKD